MAVDIDDTVEDFVQRSQPSKLKAELADMQYWEEWGKPLGLRLVGWSYRHSASFDDKVSGKRIHVSDSSHHGDSNFETFDRLRKQITNQPEAKYEVWGNWYEDSTHGVEDFFIEKYTSLEDAKANRDDYCKNQSRYAYVRDVETNEVVE